MKTAASIDPNKAPSKFSPTLVSNPDRSRPKSPTSLSSEDDERRLAAWQILHDFTALSVTAPASTAACPLIATPSRCPFGGTCHTCPVRVQAELRVGRPSDRYEQEADRVADQVMQMPRPPLLQYQTEQAEGHGKHVNPPANSLTDGGQPLSESEREFFGPRFGHDFSQVRVHTGADAVLLNDDLSSRAFTYGRDIWLREDRGSAYPHLLAHELVHTIQQGAVPRLGSSGAEAPVGIHHAHSPAIQRSVQEAGVRSPETVLVRIAASLAQTALLPIPLQLYALGHVFHPGKGLDDPRNAFVYTCKGGWIDMGHFFFTAAGAATRVGSDATWAKALATEEEQQQERTKIERMSKPARDKYIGRSWAEAKAETQAGKPEKENRRGVAWSAYTIEDLPSDNFGYEFGLKLRPFDNILTKTKEFFRRLGAVNARSNTDRLKKMMTETLGSADPEKLPRQHRRIAPVLLSSAGELCRER